MCVNRLGTAEGVEEFIREEVWNITPNIIHNLNNDFAHRIEYCWIINGGYFGRLLLQEAKYLLPTLTNKNTESVQSSYFERQFPNSWVTYG